MSLDALVDRLLHCLREGQRHTLLAAWDMGEALAENLASADDDETERSLRHVAKRLQEDGLDCSPSALRGYHSVRNCFRRVDLPQLVDDGLTLAHAQTLAGLEPELRAVVQAEMRDPDGRMMPLRRLRALASDIRRSLANRACERVLAPQPSALATSQNPDDDLPKSESRVVSPAEPEAARRSPAPPATLVLRNPERDSSIADAETASPASTGMQAALARGPKEFTRAPIGVLKKADDAALRLLGSAADVVLACDEAVRIGYDGQQALKNFLSMAGSLEASMASLEQVLPELRKHLKKALQGLA